MPMSVALAVSTSQALPRWASRSRKELIKRRVAIDGGLGGVAGASEEGGRFGGPLVVIPEFSPLSLPFFQRRNTPPTMCTQHNTDIPLT